MCMCLSSVCVCMSMRAHILITCRMSARMPLSYLSALSARMCRMTTGSDTIKNALGIRHTLKMPPYLR